MTTGSTGSVFSKWQLAVLLGAPVAIGLTYLYLRKEDPKCLDGDGKKKKLKDLKVKTCLNNFNHKTIFNYCKYLFRT